MSAGCNFAFHWHQINDMDLNKPLLSRKKFGEILLKYVFLVGQGFLQIGALSDCKVSMIGQIFCCE